MPEHQVLGCESPYDEIHVQVGLPDPIVYVECGVQREFVRFGKRDVPHKIRMPFQRPAAAGVAHGAPDTEEVT